jgi:hypothetical protein
MPCGGFSERGGKRCDVRSDYPRDMAVMTMVVEDVCRGGWYRAKKY